MNKVMSENIIKKIKKNMEMCLKNWNFYSCLWERKKWKKAKFDSFNSYL